MNNDGLKKALERYNNSNKGLQTNKNAGPVGEAQQQGGTGTGPSASVSFPSVMKTTPLAPSYTRNSQVAQSTASVVVAIENTTRLGCTIHNDTAATMYLILGKEAAASTNFTVAMSSQAYYEVPYGYTGEIRGLWSGSGTGAARVTELF